MSDRRSRSAIVFLRSDRDRRSPFGLKIAGQSRSQKRYRDLFRFFLAMNLLQVKYFKNDTELKEWKFRKKNFCLHFCKWLWASLPMKLMKYTLSTVSKMIAIGDRKATITIAIGDFFSYGDWDRDRDLKFDQDRDRNRDHNFRDRGHALNWTACCQKFV